MPARNQDLHGNVPDQSAVALVLIDVINDFEFDTGEPLFEHALPIAPRLAALKRRCREAIIPIVYVNDNFGRWRSDQRALVEHCLEDGVRGEPFVRQLLPEDQDYFVLKPKHSGFYSTTLDTLLDYLKVSTLILTGLTGDYCVLFTASDAFLRDFHVVVPADCIASADQNENEHALRHMQRVLEADVSPSDQMDLTRLLRDSRRDS
jgi:nicotinamidase-related amidase